MAQCGDVWLAIFASSAPMAFRATIVLIAAHWEFALRNKVLLKIARSSRNSNED